MIRLVLFIIRRRLHIRKNQKFYFKNQHEHVDYRIDSRMIVKCYLGKSYDIETKSNLSVNFLLSEEAKKLIVREEH